MRLRRPVADRVPDHERDEPVLYGVDARRTNAAAGADPDEDDRVEPRATSVDASEVPKKALAYCLVITSSPAAGATSGMSSLMGPPPYR